MALNWLAERSTAVGGEDAEEAAAAGVAGGAASEVRPQAESPAAQAKDTAKAATEAIDLRHG